MRLAPSAHTQALSATLAQPAKATAAPYEAVQGQFPAVEVKKEVGRMPTLSLPPKSMFCEAENLEE